MKLEKPEIPGSVPGEMKNRASCAGSNMAASPGRVKWRNLCRAEALDFAHP